MPNSLMSFLKNNSARIFVVLVALFFSYSSLIDICRYLALIIVSSPSSSFELFIATWSFLSFLAIASVAAITWLASSYLPLVAAALGYSRTPQYQVSVSGEGNIVTLPEPQSRLTRQRHLYARAVRKV